MDAEPLLMFRVAITVRPRCRNRRAIERHCSEEAGFPQDLKDVIAIGARWISPLSCGPLVQAPARGQVLHPAVGAWIQKRDEALPACEMAVADRAQRNRR